LAGPKNGRRSFFNVDPLADKYVYNSPYAFSENLVTGHVELEGLESAKAAFDEAMGDFQHVFEDLFGMSFNDSNKPTEAPKENKEQTKKKQSKGAGISVNSSNSGGRNENDLPRGDPKGKVFAIWDELTNALLGAMTKQKLSKKRGPDDRFKDMKSSKDAANEASNYIFSSRPQ